jgi:hypothetical protein
MENEFVNSDGTLKLEPSESSSATDFDFLHGKWNIHNRKLKSRLTGSGEWLEFEAEQECNPLLFGQANIDKFTTGAFGKPFEAIALRLFDPATRLWSIYWADSNIVVMDTPQVGSFDGYAGNFLARDAYNGKDIIVRFRWDLSDPEAPQWSQAFSEDEGATWEWNWFMTFTKKENKYGNK